MTKQDNHELSGREIEILRLVATGASNKEIAQKLFISPNTVKVHLRNIFEKIGAASRTEAAMYAVREGITNVTYLKVEDGSNLEETNSDINQSFEKKSVWFFFRLPRILLFSIAIISMVAILFLATRSVQTKDEEIAQTEEPTHQSDNMTNWRKLASLPTVRKNFAVGTYEGEIYVIGGEGEQSVLGDVDKYNPAIDIWISAESMPFPVYDTQAAIIDSKIFIPGGTTSTGSPTELLQIYNLEADTWELGEKLPQPITGYGLTTWNEDIYLFGGWNGNNYLATIYKYDNKLNRWELISTLPYPRAFMQTASIRESILLIGGKNTTTVFNDIQEIRLSSLRTSKPELMPTILLPYPVEHFGVSSIAEIVFILGVEQSEGTNIFQSTGLQYLLDSQNWGKFEDIPFEPLQEPTLVGLGANIHVLGGLSGENLVDGHWMYKVLNVVFFPLAK